MNIVHRISFTDTRNGPRCRLLNDLKVPITFTPLPAPAGTTLPKGLVTAVVNEKTLAWQALEGRLDDWGACDIVSTTFSAEERRGANWLSLESEWHWDFPMPDADRAYIDATYDTSKGCVSCGAGWFQKAPFRMAGEPKWGRRNILQLNWVFDEYFITPEVHERVFKPLGVGARQVVDHRSGAVLNTVVQVDVNHVSPAPLGFSDAHSEDCCGVCGRVRFLPHRRGFFPQLSGHCEQPIVKTQEWFGSGRSSWRAILIRNDLYLAFVEAGVRGVDFWPAAI